MLQRMLDHPVITFSVIGGIVVSAGSAVGMYGGGALVAAVMGMLELVVYLTWFVLMSVAAHNLHSRNSKAAKREKVFSVLGVVFVCAFLGSIGGFLVGDALRESFLEEILVPDLFGAVIGAGAGVVLGVWGGLFAWVITPAFLRLYLYEAPTSTMVVAQTDTEI